MKKLGIILSVVMLLAGVLTVATACKTKYDLSYASWDLGTETNPSVERKMVQEFEKLHKVKIELKDAPNNNAYESYIRGKIAQGDGADVFKINNTNFVLSEGYALDISEYTKADKDWANIPAAVEEAVHFKNGVYAIPFSMHMQGYFVNTTLLREQGISFPKANEEVTWNDLYDVIKALKGATNESGQALLGLSEEGSIIEWYPASADENLGYFTWDGSNYHLDHDAFNKGIEIAADIYKNHYSWESLTEEEYTGTFKSIEGYADLWNSSRLGVRWGQTYEMPDMIKKSGGLFDIRFIGIPTVEGGRSQNYSNLIADYVSIYKNTQNADLAYEFAKWMSFDPAGIAKRIELDKAEGVTNAIPLTSDQDILEDYFDAFDAIDGVQKLHSRLANAIIEPTKVFPGYVNARWEVNTGITVTTAAGSTIQSANMGEFLVACRQGFLTYRSYAKQANDLANAQYDLAVAGYINKYN